MLSVLSAQATVCGSLCLVCVFLPLFILVVLVQGVSSAVFLFCCLQRGGCGSMPHSACSFWFWQMIFLLGQELGAGYVFSGVGVSPFSCIRLAHQDAKSHYSEISALLSWWQQECCTDGCSAAVRSSGDWQQDLSSLASSSPHHQTDALKREEHTQMGHCQLLSFHAHDICLLT